MTPRLLFADRDLDIHQELPPNEADLTQDLGMDTMFRAMVGEDEYLQKVVRQVVYGSLKTDAATIPYRQAALQDCIRNTAIVKGFYDVAVSALESKKKQWFGVFGRLPGSVLFGAVELLRLFTGKLLALRKLAEENESAFQSAAFKNFIAVLKSELNDEYLEEVKAHLKELDFRQGTLVCAQLGPGNEGDGYMLLRPSDKGTSWFQRILGGGGAYTINIPEKDEAGSKLVTELRDRGINAVANATAQSSDFVLSFFELLRAEMGFYLGCVNLHRRLLEKNAPLCYPTAAPEGSCKFDCADLRDVPLTLSTDQAVAGNDILADGRKIFMITGANKGGKSTFLRSAGVAQLMMQSGMFVAAKSYSADLCRAVFTHYKREEDVSMESGKFDEELRRMSTLVDQLVPQSIILFNESFSATTEAEGSEIARQILHALLERPVKIFFVTHLYELSRGIWDEQRKDAIFLRAERTSDGARTFKLLPGDPLETSHGADLYKTIFGREL